MATKATTIRSASALCALSLLACAPGGRRPAAPESAPAQPEADQQPEAGQQPVPAAEGPISRSYVIDVVDQADLPRLRELARRYREHSAWLWRLSEGQQYIGRLRIRDASRLRDDTTFLIPAGMLDAIDLSEEAAALVNPVPFWHVELTGLAPPSVVAHELGHYEWYLDEEYDEPTCACVMAATVIGQPGGFSAPYYCSDEGPSNHTPGAQRHLLSELQGSCRTIVRQLYHPEWRFPNPDYREGSSPPATEIEIEDA